ncbi:hypothetical protein [Actinoplanes sp. RD1]|nr:hypothetical protein [Actinoplanes sp. RD1]
MVTAIGLTLKPSSGDPVTMKTTFSAHGKPVTVKAPADTVEADSALIYD